MFGVNGPHRAVNWNVQNDDYTQTFWKQNKKQLWFDEDIPVSDDLLDWEVMPDGFKKSYVYALGGLTLLDTKQGGRGMPLIGLHEPDEQKAAVFAFMQMMEQVHAKSYSLIFQTFLSKEEESDLFNWVETNVHLQRKADLIIAYYDQLWKRNPTENEKFMAKAASVHLESNLFYSGFFMPLWLKGQGKLTNAGEIIDLILRDESIHGLFVGLSAQEDFKRMDEAKQAYLRACTEELARELYEIEVAYTKDIYAPAEEVHPGIIEEVLTFIRYNSNKAMANLGFEGIFVQEEINPIVMNGLSAETKIHDFFSKKGNGYFRAVNVKPVTDATFDYGRTDL